MNNDGWSSLQKRQRINSNFLTNLADDVKNIIVVARVVDILLDNSNEEKFSNLGEWNGIGIIQFETLDKRIQKFNGYAKPIDTNSKKFPLINELVYIISTFNTNNDDNPYSINSYYINNIALWGHPHHNGYPQNTNTLPDEQRKDYPQTEAGSVRRVQNKSTEINLGKTFKERANIHPLLPFEGDVIYEGRWGNSIRLGSTVKNTPNNWSKSGIDGDPIFIIKNGQGNQTDQGWIPVIENINNDNSSIYLTSTQQIPLNASSINYSSYSSDQPSTPNKFAGEQIILSSGRLIFNSKSDHILLSSAKSINLNSVGSVNIDTPLLSVKANNIYLGENSSYQNNQPLMLGTATTNLLKDLIKSLTTFMTIASSAGALPVINSAATDTLFILNKLNTVLGVDPNLKDCQITSKRNYTV